MKLISAVLFLLLVLITESSFAWTDLGPPRIENYCDTYDARYEEVPLFQVATSDKAHFYSKKIANSQSQKKAYLINGDIVFAGPEDKGFRCVYYGSHLGNIIAGFIQANQLRPYTENKNLTQEFLVGTWSGASDDKIVITPSGADKVKGVGHAHYGFQDTESTADFEAIANFQVKEMAFKNGDCTVQMRRRGPYLIVEDNLQCGGQNATFQGIHVKVKRKAKEV